MQELASPAAVALDIQLQCNQCVSGNDDSCTMTLITRPSLVIISTTPAVGAHERGHKSIRSAGLPGLPCNTTEDRLAVLPPIKWASPVPSPCPFDIAAAAYAAYAADSSAVICCSSSCSMAWCSSYQGARRCVCKYC